MKYRLREDKDAGPKCPFCRRLFIQPGSIKAGAVEFIGGRCDCGAVYVCDPTGHNVGEALLDALNFAFGGDYASAGDIDYKEEVFNYDLLSHRMWEVKDFKKDSSGKIVFICAESK